VAGEWALTVLTFLVLAACESKDSDCTGVDCPDAVTVTCEPHDPSVSAIPCEVVDFCHDSNFECWYETADGAEYPCEPGCVCSATVFELLCDVCELGVVTAGQFDCAR
jgi:hypothetical protein